MRNFWLVAKHEYRRTVVRRGFVILTLAIPLGIVALSAMAVVVASTGKSNLPVGYVDHAGIIDASLYAALPNADNQIPVRAYPDEDAALSALNGGQIQAFFVLPAGYPETLHTDVYYLQDPPSNDVWNDVNDLVRISLLKSQPGNLQQRLYEGANFVVHDIASNREFSENDLVNIIFPFIATFFFFFATMSSAGYMLGVVAGEKENRTIEVVLTSVTPGQLIGGKALGLLAVSLTQLGIYILAAIGGIVIAARYVPELHQIVIPWGYLGIMALFFLPSYTLLAAIMVAVGGAVSEIQQGQQIAGILNLFFILPIVLLSVLFSDPNQPLMVFFTLFPTTAFVTVSLRWGLGTVPLWQIGLSWILLVTTALFMVWAAARVFRAGMLHYGQPLSLKAVVAAIRG